MVSDEPTDLPNQPFRRKVGYRRGKNWNWHEIEGLGLKKVADKLPKWTPHALGYPFNYWCFAVYPEGDFFDGRDEGGGYVGAIAHELIDMFGGNADSGLLFIKGNTGHWHAYLGHKCMVGFWLETHTEKPKHGINDLGTTQPISEEAAREVLERLEVLMSDIFVKRKRLLLWMKNTSCTSP